MKSILHVCLTAPYQDNMGYDENIMPKYHVKQGYSVYLVSCFDEKDKKKIYINNDGVRIIRIKRKERVDKLLNFSEYPQLRKLLEKLHPDIIYVHNAQFFGFWNIISYVKTNKAKLVVDNHDDYYNAPVRSLRGFISRCIFYRMVFLFSQKYVTQFFGVTPWRCQYLNKVFGISRKKINLLVMGADDELIDFSKKDEISSMIRGKYNISNDDFLFVSGGKIDRTKNIHILAKAVSEIPDQKVKLLLFGNICSDISESISELVDQKRIIHIGWIAPNEVYNYFLASNMAIFPGTHSILWEQACACGVPIIVKKWDMMNHIDLGGNAFFLDEINEEIIKGYILKFLEDKNAYNKAKKVAISKAVEYFSYSRISREAIKNC